MQQVIILDLTNEKDYICNLENEYEEGEKIADKDITKKLQIVHLRSDRI